ncbi:MULTISPECIES: penicillin-binding protein 2 [unclassified Saccharopolyspora]|uniref:peptidoglycan D,D-transpeptidase FtsI family protein n=1 Tax=unclassified Saccharopolyspora TaxID=2646250 RepID=UPI001CD6F2A3|nr:MULTISPECIES: penicillin-binding protein 2 [unclassified Saccharopolyspora]MCA1187300.1 penicillin-binding protein 2 [Saccharopolyspora sp. 6T]MCA1196224.1 penicillin-binding protein 2 [Saccharopolyspora sp. 6V]MCA1229739.1 penicillin-binding protein 2 [Saccharopolyspora sp. 6M]MCA1282813.1 penicillin-binding protein 2 [Saccharopolyspora sp. 7B]
MVRRGTRAAGGKRTARTDVAGSGRRLRIGRLLLVIALVLTGTKLILVQGFDAQQLSAAAARQRTTSDSIPAERGSFTDRSGNVLAFSSEARQLYATPRRLAEEQDKAHAEDPSEPTSDQYKREIARFITQTLGDRVREQDVLAALFADTTYTTIGPLIEPALARTITEKYSQIGQEYRATREYPAGENGANVLGGARWSQDARKIQGRLGLESSLDKLLAGTDGKKVSDTAMGSDLVIPGTERELEPAIPGSDVELTLDSDLQYMVQNKLSDYAGKTGARSASAAVLDAHTGEVYALANDESFDPNAPAWGPDGLGNPAVTNPFEPGSVNKVITAAGAIEDGLVRPETVLQVPGKIKVADRTVGDAWAHGTIPLTFTGVLGKSSNVGTLMTAQRLGEDRFNDLVHKFGLGETTGIGLPGESAGFVPAREDWSGSTFANLPIGQGLSMTVLQMAGMYQAIANDGVRVPPRVIAAQTGPDGVRVPRPRPEGVRVVSPETARTVRDMMRAVVQDAPQQQGTGKAAALDGYQISGKTGTAQQIDPDCKCYSNDTYWITFTGIVPSDNPRFVVALMLDAPGGGASAAPLFHDVAAYLTQRYKIPLSPAPAPVQTLQVR